MRIAFVTPVVPFVDGGTSAHIYHLMLHREKSIMIDVYSFNNNHRTLADIQNVEKELNVKIHIVDMPLWMSIMFKCHILFLRILLAYPIYYYLKLQHSVVTEIKSMNPDGIWIYGEELVKVSRQFTDFRCVHTLPDSMGLFCYRMLGKRFVCENWFLRVKYEVLYAKLLRLESKYIASPNMIYHLVGKADVDFIKNMNPNIDARFIYHPHYMVANPNRAIKFHHPRIKLLLAGQYNFYMKESADDLINCFVKNHTDLQNDYEITFLGKGWERHSSKLRQVGFVTSHIEFVDDYQQELIKHDIQVTPIAIGTGTKGKVLDGIANGLLLLGTPYALENIEVISGVSCLEYRYPEDALSLLLDVVRHVEVYEKMAEEGRNAIFKYHARDNISDKLFSLF